MINLQQIQKALISALEKHCGCPFVPSNTTKEMPAYPYVSFTLINDKLHKGTYCEGERLYKPLNITYSFTVQSKTDMEAVEIAMKARDFLDEIGRQMLQDGGIVIQDLTGITSRDNLLTIEFEYRKGFDAVIAVFNEIDKQNKETIETVTYKHELT